MSDGDNYYCMFSFTGGIYGLGSHDIVSPSISLLERIFMEHCDGVYYRDADRISISPIIDDEKTILENPVYGPSKIRKYTSKNILMMSYVFKKSFYENSKLVQIKSQLCLAMRECKFASEKYLNKRNMLIDQIKFDSDFDRALDLFSKSDL